MFSLVFAVCTAQSCFTVAPEALYSNISACEVAANGIMATNEEKVAAGELPVHSVIYQCINWGAEG